MKRMDMGKPDISIIICTYNRSAVLGEVLESLSRQDVDPACFEIIVVDNASTDGTSQLLKRFESRIGRFKTVYEPVQGSSHARNVGVKSADAAWLCFLDDDSKPAPNYVKTALKAISDYSFDCFGGAIKAWKRDPLPVWFIDEYESCWHRDIKQVVRLENSQFVSGGNMLIRKEAFEAVGGFNADFGIHGVNIGYGEETELQLRLSLQQYVIGYVPDLIVEHYARPEKYTYRRQLQTRYKAGFSWQMLEGNSSFAALALIFAKSLASPAKGLVISVKRLFAGSYRWQNAFLEVAGRFVFTIGRIAAWFKLRSRKS